MDNNINWCGISTPFRIENGSVVKSKSYLNSKHEESKHIEESIRLIVNTNLGDFVTKNHIGNKFRKVVFDLFSDDFDAYIRHNLIKHIEEEDYRVKINDIIIERDIPNNMIKIKVEWDINQEIVNDISDVNNIHTTIIETNINTL